jgi:undecaprenyl diphosphate synthase
MCLAGSLRGVPVRIDLIGSGLERLAATGRGLVAARTDIDEESIDEFMFGEIGEPDLVVACGPQSQSVPSLVWELAYSEIVYVDIPWRELSSAHLDYAIRDYHNRNRRFGGV